MRLEIDRLSLDCLVGGDHPDPHGARDRVVALSRGLPHSLGEQLRPFSGGDEIVLVRSLELDLTLDLDGPETANLARWSRAFAAQLARQLSARGQGVVRFAGRAEQLACFVRDLVNGDAWSLWFHHPFSGLRALPAARALSTALGSHPARGQAALALLDEGTIAKAGELLGPEVDHLAELLCGGIAEGESPADLVAPLCDAALRHLPSPGPRLLAALKAHAEAAGRPCGPGDLALCRTVVDALADESFRSGGRAASPGQERQSGSFEEPGGAPLRPDADSELAERIRRHARAAKVRRLGTLYGGPLLLLRDLDRVDLAIAPENPAGPGGWPAASALRMLVLAWLAGPARGRDFLADPFWRDLLGMPPQLSPSGLIRWADLDLAHEGEHPATARKPPWPNGLGLSAPAEHRVATVAGLVLDGFAHRLPGFSRSSPRHLFTNFLDLRASILLQGDDGLTALVSRPPLDPILALSGAASWTAEFSWTSPCRITVSREAR